MFVVQKPTKLAQKGRRIFVHCTLIFFFYGNLLHSERPLYVELASLSATGYGGWSTLLPSSDQSMFRDVGRSVWLDTGNIK